MLNNQLANPIPQPTQPLIPNPFAAQQQINPMAGMVGLTQIEGFEPVPGFTDSANTQWTLIKSSTSSISDVPDPKGIQVLSAWGHEVPGVSKIYIYVVEAIRPPRVETEQPCRLLYQWFSLREVKDFNAGMVAEREWLRANVYAAALTDTRVSQLNAMCKVQARQQAQAAAQPAPLIKLNEVAANEDHPEGHPGQN